MLARRQVNHGVVVDTSLDPEVYITTVYTAMENGTYGVGEEILVTVVFSAPVSEDGVCSERLFNRIFILHQARGNPRKSVDCCASACSNVPFQSTTRYFRQGTVIAPVR